MCGRFTQKSERELISVEFYIREFISDVFASYNLAPSEQAGVVLRDPLRPERGNLYARLQWGLVPFWAQDPSIGNRMINARAESVADKPSFKYAFRQRRCLVPVDGFFEWKKQGSSKVPYFIHDPSGRPLSLAGLWEVWDGSRKPPRPELGGPGREAETGKKLLYTFTIITTEARPSIRELHDRMPLIIPPGRRDLWLGTEPGGELPGLLQPDPGQELVFHQVSREVNAPGNKSPRCIEQVPSGEES
jgi:putative SOS response-associated peptidase YedK